MEGSAYEGGVYHGRIRLHPEYPRKAPMISLATPSGRWEVNKEICLSGATNSQLTVLSIVFLLSVLSVPPVEFVLV